MNGFLRRGRRGAGPVAGVNHGSTRLAEAMHAHTKYSTEKDNAPQFLFLFILLTKSNGKCTTIARLNHVVHMLGSLLAIVFPEWYFKFIFGRQTFPSHVN